MNNIILSLPKPILKRYVLKHFSKLSIDDFFQVVKKVEIPIHWISHNDILNKNADVLKFMLDVSSDAFVYFDSEAFTTECINKIADLDAVIVPDYIDKYPMLLQNSKICEKMIKTYPEVIKKFKVSQITDNIISILENSYYIPDEEDLNKSSLFFKSEKLIEKAISENPVLILKIEMPSDNLINIALRKGFIPEKKHFIDNPYFKTKKILLEKAFEKDPSIIVFFKKEQITDEKISSARDRGFIAIENDLLENPNLCDFKYIMEDAIENNPKLITLISEKCHIDYTIIYETLQKYKITKEDLERNPALTKNYSLMNLLPQFSLYSAYLTDEEKEKAIVNNLRISHTLTTDDLPFLDSRFGAKTNIAKINDLLNYFNISINESDIDSQQNYLQSLDKIIDGIINIRYIQNKFSFKYPDIVSLNDSLIQLFSNVSSTKDYELISKYIQDLYVFVGETIPIEQIKEEVEKYYNIYINNMILDLSTTNEFCNKILNQHRNYFMSNEKTKIVDNIKTKMKLTEKKKTTIFNGRKITKIEKIIKNADYQQLGITEEQFQIDIENVKNAILNNKDIKKMGIQIDISRLEYLAKEFKINGNITEELVIYVLKISNIEVSKFIVKKFEQIKFKYIGKIELTEAELHISQWEKEKLGRLNQTNYVIGDNDRYIQNLSELLIKLDEETINKILNNKELIKEVAFLLPFLNLIEELDINTFINILVDYVRIKNKISSTIDIDDSIDFDNIILKKIDDLIILANAYSSIDDITLFALGRNIVSEVGESNSQKYLDFYTMMLNKQSGNIPPISLEIPNHYLKSGMYSDPDRLLIGKKPTKNSCIDLLNTAGGRTYKEVLLENSADVILVRDAQKKLVTRIFLFRRGNIVQMVTSASAGPSLPDDVYKSIADQIIHQSISNNDNIDYVFGNNYSLDLKTDNYITVKDNRFVDEFPHADFSTSAILLSSKRKMQGFDEKQLELDFEVKPLVLYEKQRKKISYQPTETEITRLRALKIIMETDVETKENMSRNFEPFYSKEYIKVICGEDWYIAVKKDGSLEELVLPVSDIKSREEIEKIKSTLGININKEEINSIFSNTDLITKENKGIRR